MASITGESPECYGVWCAFGRAALTAEARKGHPWSVRVADPPLQTRRPYREEPFAQGATGKEKKRGGIQRNYEALRLSQTPLRIAPKSPEAQHKPLWKTLGLVA
ncbi:hypothetical protein NDU88_006033 [Pleurodeles waltl]|uniref:Uncharacterized protein n=1 Tax=Pleurodeles waltl TaxID=8319 RepID=A0AAV7X1B2_PLEWA|nr:hypothetical protein NDU88_006033 [Pleurodeles waltl]